MGDLDVHSAGRVTQDMRAAFLVEPEQIVIRETAAPVIGAEEVLIQPTRVGVCGSDVSLYAGHRKVNYPLLLGHEAVGRISQLGERVTKFKIGQRVVVEPNYPCGVCKFCREGRGNICSNKQSLGVTIPGCIAESFVAPAEFVWTIPDSVTDADAAMIEPLAVSLHALWQAGSKTGEAVAVVGCGATGLLLIQAAVREGIHVFALDKYPEKLEIARRLGAETVDSRDPATQWLDKDVSTVFECAGVSATVELALSAAPRGSQVVLMGLASQRARFLPLRLVREGIHVSGSIIYNHPGDFARTIDLVSSSALHPSQIVTDILPFTETDHALRLASTGRSGKIHLQIERV